MQSNANKTFIVKGVEVTRCFAFKPTITPSLELPPSKGSISPAKQLHSDVFNTVTLHTSVIWASMA